MRCRLHRVGPEELLGEADVLALHLDGVDGGCPPRDLLAYASDEGGCTPHLTEINVRHLALPSSFIFLHFFWYTITVVTYLALVGRSVSDGRRR
jgi:hypothetical protein